MKDVYDRVNELYILKMVNEPDEGKRKGLEKFFRKKYCFFEIDANTAMKILIYLGIPREEVLDVYCELVSIENYQKYMPEIRTILPDELAAKMKSSN